MKAQSTMIEEIREERPGYVGARLAKRAVTDCFARGVVRGGVETTNLTLHAGHPDPTRAESIKTAPVTEMALDYPLRLLAALREGRRWPQEPRRARVDARRNAQRKVTDCPFWTIYGGRGKRKEVHGLSAYELARHYSLQQARHPLTAAAHAKHLADPRRYHAEITEAGQGKLKHYAVELTASADYKIREAGGGDWLPLGDGEHAGPYRHDWVLMLRGRPYAPVVYGAQGGRSEDEQAARLLVLFFPWVNDVKDATAHAPFTGDFWGRGVQDCRQALLRYVFQFGFPTEEVKRLVLNFCFVYFSPRALELQEGLEPNSDNENLEDILQPLDEQDLLEASLTRVKGKGKSSGDGGASSEDEGEAPALRRDLALDMFRLSADIFLPARRGGKKDPALRSIREQMEGAAGAVVDHERARKAAAASARRSQAAAVGGLGAAPGDPSAAQREPLTAAKLQAWLRSEEVLRKTNAKQHEFLELLVDRAAVEAGLLAPARSLRKTDDPLVWLLHGPPGAGKSHALHFARKLFDAVLNYVYGLDYEVVAFQGTNAADLGGKTIHTAFGFNRGAQGDGRIKEDAAKRLAHWRWLIVDEISLTSADLLGRAEQRLRACVPSASPWKRDRNGADRPFAGVNVIFTGDFQQLKPPGGYYLADIPRSILEPTAPSKKARLSDAAVLAEHGRMLLWGGATQGITELTERERCKDEWWNEVVDELRAGRLSEKNWMYLHGQAPPGCNLSEEERHSRRRVILGPDNPRLYEEKFREAPVVVANNDVRYQINKDRAKSNSLAADTPLRWAPAADEASSAVLQTRPCGKDEKIRRALLFMTASARAPGGYNTTTATGSWSAPTAGLRCA